jgi:cell division protein FtsL
MTAIAQTSMIAACLAVLIYIAVIVTGNYFATQENITNNQNPLSQQQQLDDALHKLISTNLKY